MADNAIARTALNVACQPHSWTMTYVDGPVTGVAHAPTFTSQVVVTTAAGAVVVTGASGDHGYTDKGQAHEAACAAAQAALNAQGAGAPAAAAAQRLADAWLGDRSLLLLLALLGSEAGLTAAQMHVISETLFSDQSLAAFHPQQLGSVKATATAVEATVGAAVAPHAAALAAQLLPALRAAAPGLIAALQAAVAAAAAQQQ
jgi:hypothetical protein